ncbi:acyl-CoA dehydrogenase [Aliidiomarina indica]|uniref:acyl-CoA dehydrogenase n=1 Tax=Aliidiomarina indica TaxID=2749147 RepID=UPI00189021F4|nr:acyl-CoA dehydrogenase [Aliidiomarina indica]
MTQLLNRRDLDFLLYDVLGARDLPNAERYQDYDYESFQSIIDTAARIAEEQFLPHNQKADANEPQFDGTSVVTIPEVKRAWRAFADAGLLAARHDVENGGMQLPALIHAACNAWFMAANPSTAAYPFLTSAAANLIHAFGSETQKASFLPAMFSGDFAGTMALTEPDVGSSLGDLTTKAIPIDGQRYNIRGQKMYISGGDQDITENIVHLVLARIEGAEQGVKGISLFVVPKFRQNAKGEFAQPNDVTLAGLLHKMGYRGTTSTVLSFGEHNDCEGTIVGEPGKGLQYMFKMMNEARIGVGLGAAMIGYRGYLASLDYARQRPQGRSMSDRDPRSKPVMIIQHTDVKRMLLQQKVWSEGSLALCLYAARLVDAHEAEGDENSGILVDLLTPIVKSYPSWYGPKANDLAIQVLGGAGYTREYPVEQCYRDNRLNPIHEGTHGIQGLDLLGRKLWQHNGTGQKLLLREIQATLSACQQHPELSEPLRRYQDVLKPFMDTLLKLGEAFVGGKAAHVLGNASVFLDVMGKMVVGWLWLRMAERALATSEDSNFTAGKLQSAQYFMRWELASVPAELERMAQLDDTCMQMEEAWF